MGLQASLWSQQLAILRRRFIVLLRYPIRYALLFLVVPGLFITIAIIIGRNVDPKTTYNASGLLLMVPYLLKFTTIMHAYSISSVLVADKDTGMKSLMLSMGLSRFNYYFSMGIYTFLIVGPPSIILIIAAKAYLIDASYSYFTVVGLSLLFTLHLDAFLAAGTSLISSSIYAFLIPSLLLLGDPLLLWAVSRLIELTGPSWKSFFLFTLTVSPYQAVFLYANNYIDSHKHEVIDKNFELLTLPIWAILSSQALWILVSRLFAWWFEEVCPWQNVSAVRSCCFCLCDKSNHPTSSVDDHPESSGSSSKYFEQRSQSSREVGIRVSHVTKKFQSQYAVNDLSFTIFKGETTLLLGHNGAGKSTLMNMILGLLEPDYGFVKFKSGSNNDVSPAIGVCPQTSILDSDLTVRQHLALFSDIKSNISGYQRDQHINQTIKDISLVGQESKVPAELSGGMKRKLSLGMAFVGMSEVLILDEPSSGLDPDSRVAVWDAIRRYRSERTVLLSTQHMEEADYLGDRIAIMSAGRIVCCGSSVYLNKLFGTGYKLRVECKLSKKKFILDHIRKHYFDAAQSNDVTEDVPQLNNSDPIVDQVVELKTEDKSKDSEMELIRLLEELEKDSSKISIKSYGLKSSSIEDVMLNTSRYFASMETSEEADKKQHASSTSRNISALTGVRRNSNIGCLDLIWPLIMKNVQVHLANWLSTILLRMVLPVLGAYQLTNSMKSSKVNTFWQNPGVASMIALQLIYYPTHERASKFKIIQLTTNLSSATYWIAQILFDLLWLTIPLAAVNIIIYFSLNEPFVSRTELHGLVSLATIIFYLSSMFLCYCLSHVISDARSSITYMIFMSSFSLIMTFIVYMIQIATKTSLTWMFTGMDYLFVTVMPSDAYLYFFRGLTEKCYIQTSILPICLPRPGISSVVFGLAAMGVQMVLYLITLILIERQSFDIEWYFNLSNLCPFFGSRRPCLPDNLAVDPEVAEETSKSLAAINNPSGPHALVAAALAKSYTRGHRVIENLSFSVKKGECFGLLGINGAGKTTTFSLLATEAAPDYGRILANGRYSDGDLHEYRRLTGYDPQSTPELSLSPYQALSLMAKLRGIDDSSIPVMVNTVLALLDMSQHSNKPDGKLSGGTKRKLALGMSLIGNSGLLTLDEPTAGVDPLARRSVWYLLKSLKTHNETSIIISSHAMEECEAICDRISIMARGRLRCIGTFLHLRSKFATGCTLRVQISKSSIGATEAHARGESSHPGGAQPADAGQHLMPNGTRRSSTSEFAAIDGVINDLQQQLTKAIGPSIFRLADKNVNSATFNITDNRVRRSTLFRLMRDFRQKHTSVSYMINDSSLEDIFISLAREQQQLDRLQAPFGIFGDNGCC